METREKIFDKTKSYDQERMLRKLVLYNDEVNTFDFVIDTLVEVCKHDSIQAEQCALITHFKGKCDVKQGSFADLKPLKDSIINRGLSVVIE